MTLRFPYARPTLSDDDVAAVTEVLRDQYLTQGPRVEAFETELAASLGAEHAVTCSSGTAALHLAYLAAGLGPDRGLLTSPITFLATASAARMCGAPVVFADVNPATGNLDPAAMRETLRATRVPVAAIAVVHLGGRACDMVAFRDIADEFDCLLIEDASHAPGAHYRDQAGAAYPVGGCRHSQLATFSFHAIKHIAAGEGGAVLTNDAALADKMRRWRNHGMIREADDWTNPPEGDAPWYYEMHELGYNYRLTDLQCALGRSQLRALGDSVTRRRQIAALYDSALANLNAVTPPPAPTLDGHAWHLYQIAIDFAALGKTRGEVMRGLARRGVGTQVHYIPLYRQPYFRAAAREPLAGAEAHYAATLSIPMYPSLTDRDVNTIVGEIADEVSG